VRQVVLCVVGAAAAIASRSPLVMAAAGLAIVLALLVDALAKRGNP
jgi:hypothetical protein